MATSSSDRARLGRVGLIALLGFLIGVFWPGLAGVVLVPRAPVERSQTVAPTPSASNGNATAASAPKAKTPVVARTSVQTVTVGSSKIVNCKDERGRRLKQCDKIDIDSIAKARLANLRNCDAAKGLSGTLSLGFDLDFAANRIVKIVRGKSTTLAKSKATALIACAKKEFESASLRDIDHEQSRYMVFYFTEFVPPGSVRHPEEGEKPGKARTVASGIATVIWQSAQVHAEAEKASAVVSRLLYGTRVVVNSLEADYYLVEYGARGKKGWVHKNALGL